MDQRQMVKEPISISLDDNEAALQRIFSNCSDFHVKKLMFYHTYPGLIIYLRVLVDQKQLERALLGPLTTEKTLPPDLSTTLIDFMNRELISIGQTEVVYDLANIAERLAQGEVILLVESALQAIALKIENDSLNRQLQEPGTERLIRGPHIGFIESIEVNMALLRKKIRIPQLKLEMIQVGRITKTAVVVAYIEHLAPLGVLHEMKNRLQKIDVDIIMESGQIEELIRDAPYSPFPVMQMSERPDTVAGLLFDGKVALLTDGTPMALIAPATFWQGFQTAEDYYTSFIITTLLRWVRYLFSVMALLLPSAFIAVSTYHPEMIPTSLALSIAASREIVPFPAIVETLIMEIAFEGLREAGLRLPNQVGQTISIVGALVIGEAAVQAGIISAPIVIIVSFTGIASFLIPKVNMNGAIRLLRFPIIILAGLFGFYGISIAVLTLLIHLVNLKSFGVPYMSPVAPFRASGLADVIVRAPWRFMSKRQKSE